MMHQFTTVSGSSTCRQSLITGGTIDKVDDWGIKEFAYEIDHMKKGHYVVINVTANNARVLQNSSVCLVSANNVVRIMVVKTEDEK